MSKNSAGATEEVSKGDSASARGELSAGQLGILVIQGFTIFVAFSTLLGRIHFREYSSTLRIPESEFQMNVLSYSVSSPDVAISGVGVALVSIFAVLSFRVSFDPKHRPIVICIGVGLLANALYRVLMDFSNESIPESGMGTFGIWWLALTASWTFGTALTFSALASWLTATPIRDRRTRSAKRANRDRYLNWIHVSGRAAGFAVLCIGAGMTITLLLGITILQASLVGRMDASVQLRDAPLVELASKSQALSGMLTGDEKDSDRGEVVDRF